MLRHRAHGQRIQVIRDARELTQEQLAYLAGYSIKTIYKAEASGDLKRQTLADIATALGVELADIVDNPEGLLPTRQEDANKRLVLAALEAFQNQNLVSLLSVVHTEAVFESPGPDVFPWNGVFCRRSGIRKYFHRILQATEFPAHQRQVELIVAEGEFVDVHLRETEQSKDTGQSLTYAACFHFRVRDGRILHFREYRDYASLVVFFDANGWPGWRA
jgi:ketosteroid isomerase-like protein